MFIFQYTLLPRDSQSEKFQKDICILARGDLVRTLGQAAGTRASLPWMLILHEYAWGKFKARGWTEAQRGGLSQLSPQPKCLLSTGSTDQTPRGKLPSSWPPSEAFSTLFISLGKKVSFCPGNRCDSPRTSLCLCHLLLRQVKGWIIFEIILFCIQGSKITSVKRHAA